MALTDMSKIWNTVLSMDDLASSTYTSNSIRHMTDMLVKNIADNTDKYVQQELERALGLDSQELYTKEEKEVDEAEVEKELVLSLLKGGFEKKCGISFDRFIDVYNEILSDNPEKLI